MRKSEINRDPSQFLFRKTIGVRAGERLDQRALAVIHMARRCHDEMLNAGHFLFWGLGAQTADRSNDFRVLSRKDRAQIELKYPAFDISDNGNGMLPQKRGHFLLVPDGRA